MRQKFNAPLAMHRDDFGMIERGDMFAKSIDHNAVELDRSMVHQLLQGIGQQR